MALGLTTQEETAVVEAADYLAGLVRDYGGYLAQTPDTNQDGDPVTVTTLHLNRHPCPPHQLGWSGCAPADDMPMKLFLIEFAAMVRLDIAAHVGVPGDDCSCFECFRRRRRGG